MHNPLLIITLLLRTRRPSRMTDMAAIALPFWIRKGYDGLTFFGTIITNSAENAETFNGRFGAFKNHEMIHLYQARSTHDSWLCFYWKYLVYWLRGYCYRKHLRNAGYLLNPFEMEAYGHMYDLDYLDRNPEGCQEWKEYAAMSLPDRHQLYRRRQQR